MSNTAKHKLPTVVREVVDYAEQYGFELVKITSKSHVMLAIPNGGPIQVIPGTPSGYSWKRNAEGDIRRKSRQWADQERARIQAEKRARVSAQRQAFKTHKGAKDHVGNRHKG